MLWHRVLAHPISTCLTLFTPFLLLVVACEKAPLDPVPEEALPDTAEVRGTLVLAGDAVDGYVTLTWIPGTESVVYSTSGSTAGCAIKAVDVTTSAVTVLDDDCVDVPGSRNSRWHNIVVAADGSTLFYASMVEVDPARTGWELRSIDLASSVVSTLREDVVFILALSPDAQNLAYVAGPSNSLVIRDISAGVENVLGGFVFPLLFSPAGSELLYEEPSKEPFRLSLADNSTEAVPLPGEMMGYAYAYHWGSSGLRVLASESHIMQVRNLETGGVTVFEDTTSTITPELQTPIWSHNGRRVAYGIYRCLDEFVPPGGDCNNERVALHVADATTGTSTRVAFVRPYMGSTVFSPSGNRIVYSVNGDLYVSDVPLN